MYYSPSEPPPSPAIQTNYQHPASSTSTTFDITYHETCCGFPPNDATAATFSILPIEDMCRPILSSEPLPPEPSVNECIEVTDDLTKGYLQRTLN